MRLATGLIVSMAVLSGCGTDTTERAATAALAGAGIGALAGGPVGALIGVGVGGVAGSALPEGVDQIARRAVNSATTEVSLGQPTPRVVPQDPVPQGPVQVPVSVMKEIQRVLNRKGYNAGEVDGKIGPRTQNALAEYQARAGLARTGVLDQRTLDHLINQPEFTKFETDLPLERGAATR